MFRIIYFTLLFSNFNNREQLPIIKIKGKTIKQGLVYAFFHILIYACYEYLFQNIQLLTTSVLFRYIVLNRGLNTKKPMDPFIYNIK